MVTSNKTIPHHSNNSNIPQIDSLAHHITLSTYIVGFYIITTHKS